MARSARQSWSSTVAMAITVGNLQCAVHRATTAAERRVVADQLDAATALLIDHLHRRHIYTPYTELMGHYLSAAADEVTAFIEED